MYSLPPPPPPPPPRLRKPPIFLEEKGLYTGQPCPHVSVSFGLHVSGENCRRKRIFSKTLSRVKIFEHAGFSFTCGRTKVEVFEYDDVRHDILLVWRILRRGCYLIYIVLAIRWGRDLNFSWTFLPWIFFKFILYTVYPMGVSVGPFSSGFFPNEQLMW